MPPVRRSRTLAASPDRVWQIVGADGRDTLTGVELVQFGDGPAIAIGSLG